MLFDKNNQHIIDMKKKEWEFLHHFNHLGYDLLDLSIIEEFKWNKLSEDDLKSMTNRYTWQSASSLLSLRSDWTDAIVRYRKKYKLQTEKIAYTGPVYPYSQEKMQFGIEVFTENISEQKQSMTDLVDFIQTGLNQTFSVAVISHYSLLKKLLTYEELNDDELLFFLKERNLDRLSSKLGAKHPVVEIMSQPVTNQLNFAKEQYPDLEEPVDAINEWIQLLEQQAIPTVYSDLFSLPPQSYYKGIFLQLYTSQAIEPIVTGGQYSSPSKAFGMALNLPHLS